MSLIRRGFLQALSFGLLLVGVAYGNDDPPGGVYRFTLNHGVTLTWADDQGGYLASYTADPIGSATVTAGDGVWVVVVPLDEQGIVRGSFTYIPGRPVTSASWWSDNDFAVMGAYNQSGEGLDPGTGAILSPVAPADGGGGVKGRSLAVASFAGDGVRSSLDQITSLVCGVIFGSLGIAVGLAVAGSVLQNLRRVQ